MKDNIFLEFDSLLYKKLDLLEKLKELSKEQTNIIDDGRLEELQPLIDSKEEIMETIDQLDESLNPLLEKIKALSGLDTADWFDKLEEKGKLPRKIKIDLKSLENTLIELQKIDKLNLKKMTEKRIELGKEMMEIHGGRKINKGYSQDNRIYSTFIDRKG